MIALSLGKIVNTLSLSLQRKRKAAEERNGRLHVVVLRHQPVISVPAWYPSANPPQKSQVLKGLCSKVPIAKVTNARLDVKLVIDYRVNSCGDNANFGKGICDGVYPGFCHEQ